MNTFLLPVFYLVLLTLLGIVFCVGVVLLIAGLVTRAHANKNQAAKRSPKVLIGIALAMMILSIVSSGVIVARGLSSVYQELIEPVGDYISEQDRMAQKVAEVFAAADVGDVDAFYALFSESATDYEPDLKEQIQTFIDAYPGKPDSIVYFRTDSSGGSYPLMEADGKTVV